MDLIELKIEKSIFGGLGLSHYEGMAVLVEGAVTGDIIKAEIIKKNKNYLSAKIKEIIVPSNKRTKPFCPLYGACGGCGMQFVEYDFLIKEKENILFEIFSSFSELKIKPFVKSPKTLNYRCKTQYPVTQTKNSKRLLIGYYKKNSHDITNIKFCPVQPSVIDEITEFIRNNWNLGAYIEKTHKGLLRHINTRISTNDNSILFTFVLNADEKEYKKIKNEITDFSNLLMNNFPLIKGVFVNLNNEKTNKITGEKTFLIKGEKYIIQNLKSYSYKMGPLSFFQINPYLAEILFEKAKNLISKKGSLLDLYGGVGAIGIFMNDVADKITLVEENSEAVSFAYENYKLNNIKNYEIYEGKAENIINNFIKEKRYFENIIIDPPRKGSDNRTLECISKMTNSIIYISCNPMTLKRDAGFLIEKGFKFKTLEGFDMFPYTHHIECLAHFERENG